MPCMGSVFPYQPDAQAPKVVTSSLLPSPVLARYRPGLMPSVLLAFWLDTWPRPADPGLGVAILYLERLGHIASRASVLPTPSSSKLGPPRSGTKRLLDADTRARSSSIPHRVSPTGIASTTRRGSWLIRQGHRFRGSLGYTRPGSPVCEGGPDPARGLGTQHWQIVDTGIPRPAPTCRHDARSQGGKSWRARRCAEYPTHEPPGSLADRRGSWARR